MYYALFAREVKEQRVIYPWHFSRPSYLLTYLLTSWCRILFEKLLVTQLVKKILLSYGTQRFITVFTKSRHWTLS
jgi:hypothetical protein